MPAEAIGWRGGVGGGDGAEDMLSELLKRLADQEPVLAWPDMLRLRESGWAGGGG